MNESDEAVKNFVVVFVPASDDCQRMISREENCFGFHLQVMIPRTQLRQWPLVANSSCLAVSKVQARVC